MKDDLCLETKRLLAERNIRLKKGLKWKNFAHRVKYYNIYQYFNIY